MERLERGNYYRKVILNILRRDVKDERLIQWIKR